MFNGGIGTLLNKVEKDGDTKKNLDDIRYDLSFHSSFGEYC